MIILVYTYYARKVDIVSIYFTILWPYFVDTLTYRQTDRQTDGQTWTHCVGATTKANLLEISFFFFAQLLFSEKAIMASIIS